MRSKTAIVALISLLLAVLIQRMGYAEPLAGKIVWWGLDPNYHDSRQTNGLFELNNEIVSDVIAIAVKHGNGLALRKNGTIFPIGRNPFGETNAPFGRSDVVSIFLEGPPAGKGDSYWAIKRDGTVARWGGEPDSGHVVEGLSNIVSIAWVGHRDYVALKKDGTLLEFNLFGSETQSLKFHDQTVSNVVALASSWQGAYIVEKNGRVHRSNSPDIIVVGGETLSNVISMAVGTINPEHGLALRRDGTVVSWDGNSLSTNLPAGLVDVKAISVSGNHNLALKQDGTVLTWGNNYFGQASVPAYLSNVVAVASGGYFSLALTTGSVSSSVFVIPHGHLESMEREADLIFKGQVVSTRVETNSSFPDWARPFITEFKLISVLKGKTDTDSLFFWHYTRGPTEWSGVEPPSTHYFEVGQSYLVFAEALNRPDYLYTVPPDATNRPNEFRQMYDGGVTRTMDNRALPKLNYKEAHWYEFNLFLHDANSTNRLYAISTLELMSLNAGHEEWQRRGDFKRSDVLNALLPLTLDSDEAVANRALRCFDLRSNSESNQEQFASALIQVANNGASSDRRLNAITDLSGAHFGSISNSLMQLVHDKDENTRAAAIRLLKFVPSEFSTQILREMGADESPKVKAAIAEVSGAK